MVERPLVVFMLEHTLVVESDGVLGHATIVVERRIVKLLGGWYTVAYCWLKSS